MRKGPSFDRCGCRPGDSLDNQPSAASTDDGGEMTAIRANFFGADLLARRFACTGSPARQPTRWFWPAT
jgi:hypothetical protein